MTLLRNLPNADYHAPVLGRVSKSALDQIHRSPAHYRSWLETPHHSTPALEFGAAFHCYVLEPAIFSRTYVTAPEFDEPDFGDCRYGAAKKARDAWRQEAGGSPAERKAAWQAANAEKRVISADWAATIAAMGDALMVHPLASRALDAIDAEAEVTVRWQDPDTGLECQCRPDLMVPSLGLVVDLKSALDASPKAFPRDCARYRYHVQDALYRAGLRVAGVEARHFLFISVEKEAPFGVCCHELDSDAVSAGYQAARRDIETLAHCMATGMWPSYAPIIHPCSLPRWAA